MARIDSTGKPLQRAGAVPARSLWQRIREFAFADAATIVRGGPDQGSLERLEEILLAADFGVPTTMRLVAEVERAAARGEVRTADQFHEALRRGVEGALRTGRSDPALALAPPGAGPSIVLVIGVNGAGKTTCIGKLAHRLRAEGRTVLVAAGDTFRAGAVDQLREWARRAGAEFVGAVEGRDPAAVAVDAIEAGRRAGSDVIIIDTAGRLHTSGGLMDELEKVARVIARRVPGAPHESLLVLDGTIGQNAVVQARTFSARVPVTGLVVTKVDGTAKGGVVVAVHEAIDAPVKFLGTGEAIDDLEPFDADAFSRELLAGV